MIFSGPDLDRQKTEAEPDHGLCICLASTCVASSVGFIYIYVCLSCICPYEFCTRMLYLYVYLSRICPCPLSGLYLYTYMCVCLVLVHVCSVGYICMVSSAGCICVSHCCVLVCVRTTHVCLSVLCTRIGCEGYTGFCLFAYLVRICSCEIWRIYLQFPKALFIISATPL